MGAATFAPGDRISEHCNPYSEEFIYVVSGELDAQLDGKSRAVESRQRLMTPTNLRHRLVNDGDHEEVIVFHRAGGATPRPPSRGHRVARGWGSLGGRVREL